jgi:hypothetical protein
LNFFLFGFAHNKIDAFNTIYFLQRQQPNSHVFQTLLMPEPRLLADLGQAFFPFSPQEIASRPSADTFRHDSDLRRGKLGSKSPFQNRVENFDKKAASPALAGKAARVG